MSLIEYLRRLDDIFFVLIHNDSDHRLLDGIMLLLLHPLTSIPVYIVVVYKAAKKEAQAPWMFLLFCAITIAITAGVDELLLLPGFARLSPCFDPQVRPFVHGLLARGGLYSFPAPAEGVYCGLTAFWFGSVFHRAVKRWRWLWMWPALLGYASIYAGQHFPSDIAAAVILGVVTGWGMARLFHYFGGRKGFSPTAPSHSTGRLSGKISWQIKKSATADSSADRRYQTSPPR